MFKSYIGEISALTVALLWAANAIAFEDAGKRVGSLAVNYIRLVIGLIFLCIFTFFTRGYIFPSDASTHAWIWLSASGVVGCVIGDLLLFEAFIIIGARLSMLIMSIVPPVTAIIAWLVLKETMSGIEIIGMLLTVTGISIVILERGDGKTKIKISHSVFGLLCAVGGSLGQAGGLILSKYGMGDYNVFAATQIRLISALIGFTFLFFIIRKWKNVLIGFKDKKAMVGITLGSFLGPFLGISLSLLALQHANAGIVSTLIAVSPLLIIPMAVIFLKEKVNYKEIIGAVVCVSGVIIFFI